MFIALSLQHCTYDFDLICMSSCALIKIKAQSRTTLKIRGETDNLHMEMERWLGLKREMRAYKECDSGEVEDE